MGEAWPDTWIALSDFAIFTGLLFFLRRYQIYRCAPTSFPIFAYFTILSHLQDFLFFNFTTLTKKPTFNMG